MHDLIGGRAAWTVLGLPTEGAVGDRHRVRDHVRPAPSVGVDATIADIRGLHAVPYPVAVLDADGVLLGAVDRGASQLPPGTRVDDIMTTAPGTIRPDVRVDEALEQLHTDGLTYTFVTTARGVIVGIIDVAETHV